MTFVLVLVFYYSSQQIGGFTSIDSCRHESLSLMSKYAEKKEFVAFCVEVK